MSESSGLLIKARLPLDDMVDNRLSDGFDSRSGSKLLLSDEKNLEFIAEFLV